MELKTGKLRMGRHIVKGGYSAIRAALDRSSPGLNACCISRNKTSLRLCVASEAQKHRPVGRICARGSDPPSALWDAPSSMVDADGRRQRAGMVALAAAARSNLRKMHRCLLRRATQDAERNRLGGTETDTGEPVSSHSVSLGSSRACAAWLRASPMRPCLTAFDRPTNRRSENVNERGFGLVAVNPKRLFRLDLANDVALCMVPAR